MRNIEKTLLLIALGASVGIAAAELSESGRDTLTRQSVGAQQMAGQAENLMREGNQLYLDDKYKDAISRYISAKQLFERFRSPEFERRAKACDEQIRKCYYQLAEEAYAAADKSASEKDFDAALSSIREAVKLYPEGESRAKAKIAEIEKRKAAAAMREKTNTSALTPERESQKYRMEVLLRQGQELARAGRYAEAAQKFNSVLMIDPYHATALHDLKAVNMRNRKIAENRYRTEHRKIITETEWRWTVPGVTEAKESSAISEGPVLKEADASSELEQKIKAIILPEFKVENCTVAAVVRALQEASRIYDPEKGRGVNIFLRRPSALLAMQQQQQQQQGEGGEDGGEGPAAAPAPAPAPAPAAAPAKDQSSDDDEDADENGGDKNQLKITMDIRKRSLEFALRELCRTAKLRMRVDSHAVVLAPEDVALSDMETVLFPVEKSIFGDINTDDKNALQGFFKDREVTFPQGAKIVYVSLLSRLVVTNTAENLTKIEEILQLLQEDREPLVEITTKFMEVNQNNLKELGFEYSLNYNKSNVPYNELGATQNYSSHRLSFSDAGTGLLRSSTASEGNSLITISGNAGGDSGLDYTVNVNALNRMDSGDALASPRIITLPGMPAHIEMVRSVPFVDDYDDADYTQEGGNSSSTSSTRSYYYKGPMPSFQDATDLGIIMDVEPKVDKVNRKITLQVKPKVVTHVGWTTWESTSTDGSKEVMRKPILARRSIDTTVTINDGKTIVLGGVVDDQAEVLDDKIPILGDLPLVGRFFQSRYTSAEKRNLLIFITCRLINPDGTAYRSEKVSPTGIPSFGRLE